MMMSSSMHLSFIGTVQLKINSVIICNQKMYNLLSSIKLKRLCGSYTFP